MREFTPILNCQIFPFLFDYLKCKYSITSFNPARIKNNTTSARIVRNLFPPLLNLKSSEFLMALIVILVYFCELYLVLLQVQTIIFKRKEGPEREDKTGKKDSSIMGLLK